MSVQEECDATLAALAESDKIADLSRRFAEAVRKSAPPKVATGAKVIPLMATPPPMLSPFAAVASKK